MPADNADPAEKNIKQIRGDYRRKPEVPPAI